MSRASIIAAATCGGQVASRTRLTRATRALVGGSYSRAGVSRAGSGQGRGLQPWWAVSISALGWVIGGIAYPFGAWVLVAIGAALQVVAIIVNLALNAAGYGAAANDQWAQAKAAAKAARAEQR
jgi:hypothetical protein